MTNTERALAHLLASRLSLNEALFIDRHGNCDVHRVCCSPGYKPAKTTRDITVVPDLAALAALAPGPLIVSATFCLYEIEDDNGVRVSIYREVM